ncbi:MAG TPA: hypothetical protein DHD79_07645 [Firmicutes bacterium]|jgi:stage III sporulation protein AF|nr:hypothetical protein [Bacillota bacterium]HAW71924.1 hypothetical protein [Bacillota bacterium]HAZ22547.1 hypothetical protein [Bacillota bacterium]HBE06263.1 hypothetical protein [Bacillota bacterium]HBG43465.1 hypothetical protein [Bacillota bacterium]
MDILRQWLKSVTVIIIIGGFLENLMPADDTRKFVRMVINLLLVLALISPLVPLVTKGIQAPTLPQVMLPAASDTAELVTAGQDLARQSQNLFLSEGQQQLEERISEIAQMIDGVTSASAAIQMDGYDQIYGVSLTIECQASDYDVAADRIRRTVAALLDADPALITIFRANASSNVRGGLFDETPGSGK